jgi:multisubunit Na+/H+ antiporter MnhG subunit
MSLAIEIMVSIALLVGAAFALIGSWGLAKLPDFYMRLPFLHFNHATHPWNPGPP